MALPDRPTFVIRWHTGLPDDLLKALGNLAVVSAQIEEVLHRVYWKHAGLTSESGPIVTDNLNPKRLAEDILKFAALEASKAHVLADLKILLAEFEALNTKRNQCIHWMWSIAGQEQPEFEDATREMSAAPYGVERPAYRQKRGQVSAEFRLKDVEQLVMDCSWLLQRLRSHVGEEDALRRARASVSESAAFRKARSLADVFFPAPWLDKQPPQDSTASDPPEERK